ncbi:MAG: hypothetical protein ACI9C1_002673 [Candidatus Aldehydirespiratoraceae bacterium]|jgi:hypothetical protein
MYVLAGRRTDVDAALAASLRGLRVMATIGTVLALIGISFAFSFAWWLGLAALYLAPIVPLAFIRLAEIGRR